MQYSDHDNQLNYSQQSDLDMSRNAVNFWGATFLLMWSSDHYGLGWGKTFHWYVYYVWIHPWWSRLDHKLRQIKGYSKKPPFSKFDVLIVREPLVPGGCPSQDLVYSWVHQVLRRTVSWDQWFTRKLYFKFSKRRVFFNNPLTNWLISLCRSNYFNFS